MIDAFASAEAARRIENAILIGRVVEVDRQARRAKVEIEDGWTSAALPWIERRAGDVRSWSPPTVGEQCLILCPGGDPERGLVLPGVASDAFALDGDPELVELLETAGGFADEIDAALNRRTITIPGGGELRVVCGAAQIDMADDRITLKVGSAELIVSDGAITLKADTVNLGDVGGQPVGRVNDAISTAPPKIVAGSAKVRAA